MLTSSYPSIAPYAVPASNPSDIPSMSLSRHKLPFKNGSDSTATSTSLKSTLHPKARNFFRMPNFRAEMAWLAPVSRWLVGMEVDM